MKQQPISNFGKIEKNTKAQQAVKSVARAKRLRLKKQLNAHLSQNMGDTEIGDFLLGSKRRCFRLFFDADIFEKDFRRLKSATCKNQPESQTPSKSARKDSDLFCATQSSQKPENIEESKSPQGLPYPPT